MTDWIFYRVTFSHQQGALRGKNERWFLDAAKARDYARRTLVRLALNDNEAHVERISVTGDPTPASVLCILNLDSFVKDMVRVATYRLQDGKAEAVR